MKQTIKTTLEIQHRGFHPLWTSISFLPCHPDSGFDPQHLCRYPVPATQDRRKCQHLQVKQSTPNILKAGEIPSTQTRVAHHSYHLPHIHTMCLLSPMYTPIVAVEIPEISRIRNSALQPTTDRNFFI